MTISGCSIDFGGTVVVSYNGSLGVASVYGGGAVLTGSFQFDQLELGAITLSSQHRVDTGVVINMVTPRARGPTSTRTRSAAASTPSRVCSRSRPTRTVIARRSSAPRQRLYVFWYSVAWFAASPKNWIFTFQVFVWVGRSTVTKPFVVV